MGSGQARRADELILRVYDTVLDQSTWSELLQDIADYCNARGAFLFEMEGQGAARKLNALRHSSLYDPQIIEAYLTEHQQAELSDQDFFASRSQSTDGIELVPDDDISDELGGDDVFSRPHMQMQMKFGLKHRAGALLNKDDLYRDRFALQFPVEYGPVRAEDRARAGTIMPHLAKALNLARPTLQTSRLVDSVTKSVDALNIGICVIDDQTRVIYSNTEFRRQISKYRAMRVTPDGKLMFDNNHFDRSVIELLGHYSNHGKFGARPRKEAVASVLKDDPTFALCVEIAPLPSAESLGEARLDGHIVYSLDTSLSHHVRTDMLERLFKLTRSESAVVELMAEGMTNQQISDHRNKSIHTINSQVKSVLSKTNAANRTQLIRLATNLSVNFPG